MTPYALAGGESESRVRGPRLDAGLHPSGRWIFTALLVGGLAYAGYSIATDTANVGEPMAMGVFAFLGLALLIALGFEFVNGFHDTANAVATVIYTHSMPAPLAVVWSGFFNFLGVLLSSGAVAYSIITLLPIDLMLHVGSAGGFAMIFALLLAFFRLLQHTHADLKVCFVLQGGFHSGSLLLHKLPVLPCKMVQHFLELFACKLCSAALELSVSFKQWFGVLQYVLRIPFRLKHQLIDASAISGGRPRVDHLLPELPTVHLYCVCVCHQFHRMHSVQSGPCIPYARICVTRHVDGKLALAPHKRKVPVRNRGRAAPLQRSGALDIWRLLHAQWATEERSEPTAIALVLAVHLCTAILVYFGGCLCIEPIRSDTDVVKKLICGQRIWQVPAPYNAHI